MAPSLSVDVIQDSVLPTLLQLAVDPIPNIRFNVAKSLEVIVMTLKQTPEGQAICKEKIVPALQGLMGDSDADVRYFASRALEKSAASENTRTLSGCGIVGMKAHE
jgi:serine/threonine-protein phosphatase 2A regulatory subunit A